MRVGAVAPSSDALVRIITAEIGASHGPVIELGPGIGAFTRALIQRGVRANDLVLVEAGSDFTRMLSLRHPHARVVWMDAARLGAYPDLLGGAEAGAAVSGLPILSMTARKQMAILTGRIAPKQPVPRTSVPSTAQTGYVWKTVMNRTLAPSLAAVALSLVAAPKVRPMRSEFRNAAPTSGGDTLWRLGRHAALARDGDRWSGGGIPASFGGA